jgi:hypothetical protein
MKTSLYPYSKKSELLVPQQLQIASFTPLNRSSATNSVHEVTTDMGTDGTAKNNNDPQDANRISMVLHQAPIVAAGDSKKQQQFDTLPDNNSKKMRCCVVS